MSYVSCTEKTKNLLFKGSKLSTPSPSLDLADPFSTNSMDATESSALQPMPGQLRLDSASRICHPADDITSKQNDKEKECEGMDLELCEAERGSDSCEAIQCGPETSQITPPATNQVQMVLNSQGQLIPINIQGKMNSVIFFYFNLVTLHYLL